MKVVVMGNFEEAVNEIETGFRSWQTVRICTASGRAIMQFSTEGSKCSYLYFLVTYHVKG